MPWGQKKYPESRSLRAEIVVGSRREIHVRVDGTGRPFTFALTPGQQHDATMADVDAARGDPIRKVWSSAPSAATIGRGIKAYGSRQFKRHLRRRGIQPVIPRKRNQKRGRPHNAALYRERNIVERFFGRLKHFRAVAIRYDKRATTYLATVL